MSIVNSDDIINNILNGTINELSDSQLLKLKNILYMNLHDIDMYEKSYEVSLTDDDNDTKKIERFIISKKVSGKSNKSIDQYVRTVKDLRLFINKDFCSITSNDIKYYLAYKQQKNNWSNTTVINQYYNLRSFYRFLLNEEYILKNPMDKIEKIKQIDKPKEPFSAEDLEKLRNACWNNIREITLIEFAVASALRVSSIVALRWCDINLKTYKGKVRVKGGDTRIFRFSKKSAYYLSNLLEYRMKKENRTYDEMMSRPIFASNKINTHTKDYEALTTDGVRSILNNIAKKAGVQNVHPHRFRRTFACQAIEHGMPIDQVQEVLMHTSIDTTLKYTQISESKTDQSYITYCE